MTTVEYIKRVGQLPKWVRDYIGQLQEEVGELKAREKAHSILQGRAWSTLTGPQGADEYLELFQLVPNAARQVCVLGKGDVLLVGRAERKLMVRCPDWAKCKSRSGCMHAEEHEPLPGGCETDTCLWTKKICQCEGQKP
jgi:hypothetical protein